MKLRIYGYDAWWVLAIQAGTSRSHMILFIFLDDSLWFQGLTDDRLWFQGLTDDRLWFQGLIDDRLWFQGLIDDRLWFQNLKVDDGLNVGGGAGADDNVF